MNFIKQADVKLIYDTQEQAQEQACASELQFP